MVEANALLLVSFSVLPVLDRRSARRQKLQRKTQASPHMPSVLQRPHLLNVEPKSYEHTTAPERPLTRPVTYGRMARMRPPALELFFATP